MITVRLTLVGGSRVHEFEDVRSLTYIDGVVRITTWRGAYGADKVVHEYDLSDVRAMEVL